MNTPMHNKLQALKNKAGAQNEKYKTNKTWRDVRRTLDKYSGFTNNEKWFVWDSKDHMHMTTKFADEVVRINHTGWYADDTQETIYRAMIIKMPRNKWLAGYFDSCSETLIFEKTIYTDETSAARAADSVAAHEAEIAREYSEKWSEAQRASDNIEQISEEICKVRAIRITSKFRDSARADVTRLCQRIRKIRNTAQSEFEAYLLDEFPNLQG